MPLHRQCPTLEARDGTGRLSPSSASANQPVVVDPEVAVERGPQGRGPGGPGLGRPRRRRPRWRSGTGPGRPRTRSACTSASASGPAGLGGRRGSGRRPAESFQRLVALAPVGGPLVLDVAVAVPVAEAGDPVERPVGVGQQAVDHLGRQAPAAQLAQQHDEQGRRVDRPVADRPGAAAGVGAEPGRAEPQAVEDAAGLLLGALVDVGALEPGQGLERAERQLGVDDQAHPRGEQGVAPVQRQVPRAPRRPPPPARGTRGRAPAAPPGRGRCAAPPASSGGWSLATRGTPGASGRAGGPTRCGAGAGASSGPGTSSAPADDGGDDQRERAGAAGGHDRLPAEGAAVRRRRRRCR